LGVFAVHPCCVFLTYAPPRVETGPADRASTQPRRLTPACRRRAALGGAEKFLLPPREQDVAERSVQAAIDDKPIFVGGVKDNKGNVISAKSLDLCDGSLWAPTI
jgi:hypothetical protein